MLQILVKGIREETVVNEILCLYFLEHQIYDVVDIQIQTRLDSEPE